MRMNGTELFDAFAEDFSTPAPEDAGAKIAEAMEAKLSALMDKYEKKLQELTEANAVRPEDPEPDEGGGADA